MYFTVDRSELCQADFTDLAVIDVTPDGFKLIECAPGVSVEEIKKATEGTLIVEGEIPEMVI